MQRKRQAPGQSWVLKNVAVEEEEEQEEHEIEEEKEFFRKK